MRNRGVVAFGLILKNFLLAVVVFLATCVYAQENELYVFSGRKEPLIRPVIDLFEKQTGIKVILKTGKSTALGQQILQELPNPSADVYIAKESGSLEYLRMKDAFEIYRSEATSKIPSDLKARDGSWIGVSGRSRALIYNKELISKESVPTTLEELLDTKFQGKLAAVNAGNESFVAWVSALRLKLGDEKVKYILEGLKKNQITLVSKSHTDIRKAVGRGEFPMGLINHYYYHLQRHEADPALRNVGTVYLDQEVAQRGEIINVSGVAIVKGAKNLRGAQKFVDFLASVEAQKLFAEVNFEFPLLPSVAAHPEVFESLNCSKESILDCIHSMGIALDKLGPEVDKTHALLEEINWY